MKQYTNPLDPNSTLNASNRVVNSQVINEELGLKSQVNNTLNTCKHLTSSKLNSPVDGISEKKHPTGKFKSNNLIKQK